MRAKVTVWCTNQDKLAQPPNYYLTEGDSKGMEAQGWIFVETLEVRHRELTQQDRVQRAAIALRKEQEALIERHRNEFESLRERMRNFEALAYDLGGAE